MKGGLEFIYYIHIKMQFLLHRKHLVLSLERRVDKYKWKTTV